MYVLLDSKPSKLKNGDYPLLLLAACSETYSDASKENVEQKEIKKYSLENIELWIGQSCGQSG